MNREERKDQEMCCALLCMSAYLLEDQGDRPNLVEKTIAKIRTEFSRMEIKRVIRRLRSAQAQYRMENRLEKVAADYEETISFMRRAVLGREAVKA